MKYSIILVSFQAGVKLKKTVESVLGQDFMDYEVVIQDGGSTDGSVQDVPQDARIRLYQEKDAGIYDAMNKAVQKAEGDYIMFLNCGDSFYDREVLKKVSRYLEKQPEAGIYYGNIYAEAVNSLVSSNPKMNAFACYRNVPCHQACFYERRLMKKKGFEMKYKVRADYEQFLWSYFCGGAKPCYMDLIVASYEGGGYSETQENKKTSEAEHREITGIYMKGYQRLGYRLLLLLTLAPLRSKIAESKRLAGCYNRLKKILYH